MAIFLASLCITFNFNAVEAFTRSEIEDYKYILETINMQYSTNFYIMDEFEFEQSPVANIDYNYQEYIQSIIQLDEEEFKNQCLELLNIDTVYNVKLETLSRSTLTTKTVNFYSARNSMTLTYKYSGSTFDTSYKPTATVKKINATNYFSMTSYSGAFKNSNKTYTVTAKGKIYSSVGVVSNQQIAVNFNL